MPIASVIRRDCAIARLPGGELRTRLEAIATVMRLTASQTVKWPNVSCLVAIVHLPAGTAAPSHDGSPQCAHRAISRYASGTCLLAWVRANHHGPVSAVIGRATDWKRTTRAVSLSLIEATGIKPLSASRVAMRSVMTDSAQGCACEIPSTW